jgi:hypothetical protein
LSHVLAAKYRKRCRKLDIVGAVDDSANDPSLPTAASLQVLISVPAMSIGSSFALFLARNERISSKRMTGTLRW